MLEVRSALKVTFFEGRVRDGGAEVDVCCCGGGVGGTRGVVSVAWEAIVSKGEISRERNSK